MKVEKNKLKEKYKNDFINKHKFNYQNVTSYLKYRLCKLIRNSKNYLFNTNVYGQLTEFTIPHSQSKYDILSSLICYVISI